MQENKKRAGKMAFVICLTIVVALVAGFDTALARKKGPPTKWGIRLPLDRKTLQDYRATATYRFKLGPEETVKRLVALLGSSSVLNVYRSRIGTTLVVFIEPKTRRRWSSIQVSGMIGRPYCYVTITKRGGTLGWSWKWLEKVDKWDYQWVKPPKKKKNKK